jgi:hypothetical protein
MKEIIEDIEIIERYLILLLGVVDRPIPSKIHLQKELFLLSKANPKIAEFIDYEKHYKGPYSVELDDVSKEPLFYTNAFEFDKYQRLFLTNEGRKVFNELIEENSNNPRFKELIKLIKMTRELYDKLSKNELLFLVYATYKDYTKKSDISDHLLSRISRKKFSRKLLDKGIISEKRAKELAGA